LGEIRAEGRCDILSEAIVDRGPARSLGIVTERFFTFFLKDRSASRLAFAEGTILRSVAQEIVARVGYSVL
jgi:hypothetical protein